ncbi:S-layer homology domain-containing protein [Solibacillus sp. CAU 1738]|uniref:S-layer homology domain-containing protein n=1 Tax=Solibacillus sp. CAU 1738 TaxID=3140363 RepID=UPI0032603224
MKKWKYGLLSVAAWALLTVPVFAEKNFSDIQGTHQASIVYLDKVGAFDSLGWQQYKVNESITRSESMQIMYDLFHEKIPAERQYTGFTDVSTSHPNYKAIEWSYEAGIIDGTDGKFNPNGYLKRSHFAKILANAFNMTTTQKNTFKDVSKSTWAYEFVNILYANGITISESFMPNDNMSRGQLATFLVRTIQHSEGKTNESQEVAGVNTDKFTGKAIKSFNSEYDFTWKQTGQNKDTEFFGVDSLTNEIEGQYTAKNGTKLFSMTVGTSTYADVVKKYGQPIENFVKGNTQYKYSDAYNGNDFKNIYGIYIIDDKFVTFFYDKFNNSKVRSIMWIDVEEEKNKQSYWGAGNAKVARAHEAILVELINEARSKEGLQALTNKSASVNVAFLHSDDMAKNGYFSHANLKGQSPKQRFNANGMKPTVIAENIAAGQFNAFYAHEEWLNSKGHRPNVLLDSVDSVLVGVAYDKAKSPFYTINFYK